MQYLLFMGGSRDGCNSTRHNCNWRSLLQWNNEKLTILWMVGNPRRWCSALDKCNKKAWVLNKFSSVQVINACTSLGALENGRHISETDQSNWMRLWYLCGGIASLICNAICRSMEEALTVFCRIPSLPGQWGSSAIRFLISHGTLFIRPPSNPLLRIYNLILPQKFFPFRLCAPFLKLLCKEPGKLKCTSMRSAPFRDQQWRL